MLDSEILYDYKIHAETDYKYEPLTAFSTYTLFDEDDIATAKVIKAGNENYYNIACESDEVFEETLFASCDNTPFVNFLEDECLTLWYISHLSVKEEYRGKGFGSALLKFIKEEILQHAKPMILLQSGTGTDEEKADEFYLKNGYIQVAKTSFDNTIFCKVFDLSLENEIQGSYLFRKEKNE